VESAGCGRQEKVRGPGRKGQGALRGGEGVNEPSRWGGSFGCFFPFAAYFKPKLTTLFSSPGGLSLSHRLEVPRVDHAHKSVLL
jgi:hypothetical protein